MFFRYVLVGVTAWGVRPCGKKDQPGIYASVSDSLCFIFWSSKCYSGSNPFQDYEPYCKTWIEDEISEVENSRSSSKYVENLNDLKNCKIIDWNEHYTVWIFPLFVDITCRTTAPAQQYL